MAPVTDAELQEIEQLHAKHVVREHPIPATTAEMLALRMLDRGHRLADELRRLREPVDVEEVIGAEQERVAREIREASSGPALGILYAALADLVAKNLRPHIQVRAVLARENDRLRRREADIIEACERVADGGQYRADIIGAINRIRRERDEALTEVKRLKGPRCGTCGDIGHIAVDCPGFS